MMMSSGMWSQSFGGMHCLHILLSDYMTSLPIRVTVVTNSHPAGALSFSKTLIIGSHSELVKCSLQPHIQFLQDQCATGYIKYWVVEQLVEAPCYKPEGRGFAYWWVHWIFLFYLIIPTALWLWGRLSLQQKWVPAIFLVDIGRSARKADDLTIVCVPIALKMWEPRRLTILWVFTTCFRDCFTFIFYWVITPSLSSKFGRFSCEFYVF
jgi:hypothetical protein